MLLFYLDLEAMYAHPQTIPEIPFPILGMGSGTTHRHTNIHWLLMEQEAHVNTIYIIYILCFGWIMKYMSLGQKFNQTDPVDLVCWYVSDISADRHKKCNLFPRTYFGALQ